MALLLILCFLSLFIVVSFSVSVDPKMRVSERESALVSAICNFRIFLGGVSLGSVLEPKSKSRPDVVFVNWKPFWLFSWCADFYCKSELVSAIFGSPKCLQLRGWNVVQFCVFETLAAHLCKECLFEHSNL